MNVSGRKPSSVFTEMITAKPMEACSGAATERQKLASPLSLTFICGLSVSKTMEVMLRPNDY